MTITYQGKDNFTIKTKNKTVKIGEKISLGELDIYTPGEFEAGGVQVEVIDGIIEVISEKITIGWIKKAKVLRVEELEKLNGINVLLVGIGGDSPAGEFSETNTAIEVVSQIEPQFVIPMYSQGLEAFLKEENVTSEPQEQIKFTFLDLPQDERKVIVLNPSTLRENLS